MESSPKVLIAISLILSGTDTWPSALRFTESITKYGQFLLVRDPLWKLNEYIKKWYESRLCNLFDIIVHFSALSLGPHKTLGCFLRILITCFFLVCPGSWELKDSATGNGRDRRYRAELHNKCDLQFLGNLKTHISKFHQSKPWLQFH